MAATPRVPAGRGGGAAVAFRRNPTPDRSLARTARGGGPTGASDEARGAEGEPCAHDRSATRKPPADQAPAVLTTGKPLSGGELRPTYDTRCEKTHGQGLNPVPVAMGLGGIQGTSAHRCVAEDATPGVSYKRGGKLMRRTTLVLSSALALALCGLYADGALGAGQSPAADMPAPGARAPAASALPAGHVPRYRVTYLNSQTGAPNRSATVVSITNQSNASCSTSVDWRVGFGGVSCTTTLTLGAGQTGEHCARSVPGAISVCNVTCSPELTSIEGSAVVGSINRGACNKIAVDARVYHTTGNADDAVAAISNPKVVRFGLGNAGD